MQILIPFSSTVALIADDESYLLSAMELHGVTQNDSGITGTAVLESFIQSQGRLIVKAADGIRVDGGAVLSKFAGGGTRHLVVDNNGVVSAVGRLKMILRLKPGRREPAGFFAPCPTATLTRSC